MVFTLPDFMASPERKKRDEQQRPRPLKLSQSFIKPPPASPDPVTRVQRASTIHNGVSSDTVMANKSTGEGQQRTQSDVFEKAGSEEEEGCGSMESPGKLPDDFDKLPIELVSLSDSFIDSLSAKVHSTPPSVDKLSALFQDFYVVAANHINTHISALSSRQHRASSPAPSVATRIRQKAASISNKDGPKVSLVRRESEQQMLTAEEITDRKRARRILEQKRVALEEAVERRVTEGIYSRIWRHRSTQDEAQDEKLRSKTAALSVVGIGLTDLGIDLGQDSSENPDATEDKEKEVREWLEGAREELIAMNDEKYPVGKLHHLKAAHKAIVDTLSHFHPSSSADEIMPMLIYTLITSRPEGIDVISNLYFIQRFRNEGKIDGEAAYCLTNLEAAITFLETVDLASLRADENPSGPAKSNSRPTTPRLEKPDSMLVLTPSPKPSSPAVNTDNASPTFMKSHTFPAGLRPTQQIQNRRLSDMFQPPAALGAAGDAVMNTADQGFKTIGNSLGESYKFLVGKLKERQEESSGQKTEIIVPKTLDDARKLVSTPPLEEEEPVSGASSLHSTEVSERARAVSGPKMEDKVLSIIGGRKISRDRSTDSVRSSSTTGSSKKVAFVEEGTGILPSPLNTSAPAPAPANPAIVESMRNLGNSLNPMNRIAGMGMMRGFGRTTPVATTPTTLNPSKSIPDGGIADLTTAFPDLAPSLPAKEVPKVTPPIKKFMELQNPGELRINEVLELLRDYRRLAGALKDLGAV
ncbi:related to VPS9 (involved in vacuole trafficking) [Rhynchosporium graminicola]|uniref:Related to VPS9 (Involved in vacuole trafficking) n=1 Tax=Rhynchosporium graminicola TaxID=2792576 RepID=A0A1E1L4B1_9HELO|nr:related to VPS9 (involved in vacuole trafficking) [Rhynchosporium commune]